MPRLYWCSNCKMQVDRLDHLKHAGMCAECREFHGPPADKLPTTQQPGPTQPPPNREEEDMTQRIRRTPEQEIELVKSVQKLVADGHTTRDALEIVGIPVSNYDRWRKKHGLAVPKRSPPKNGEKPGKSAAKPQQPDPPPKDYTEVDACMDVLLDDPVDKVGDAVNQVIDAWTPRVNQLIEKGGSATAAGNLLQHLANDVREAIGLARDGE